MPHARNSRPYSCATTTASRLLPRAALASATLAWLSCKTAMARESTDHADSVSRIRPEQGLAKSQNEEPIWCLGKSLLNSKPGNGIRAEKIAGIEGAILCHNVLGDDEVDTLVAMVLRLGFSSGSTLVEVPTEIRNNEVSLLVPPSEMVMELSARLEPFLPTHGHAAAKRCDPEFIVGQGSSARSGSLFHRSPRSHTRSHTFERI